MLRVSARLASLCFVFAAAGSLRGQCASQFVPLLQRCGVDGPIACSTLWDPDGPGPLAQRLVIGGTFTVAGDTMAARIAVFDFVSNTWSTLGSGVALAAPWYGFNNPQPAGVSALLAMPNDTRMAPAALPPRVCIS